MDVQFRNVADEVVGSVYMRDGRVVFDAGAAWIRRATVVDPKAKEVVTPDDGERYLRALPANFQGPYFHAVLNSP